MRGMRALGKPNIPSPYFMRAPSKTPSIISVDPGSCES